ncbi:MAG: SDR family NAD(P)-dependent oxidoreductase [Polyangiaceae bacterium]|nr:SDR family NAD(P)-dependent oxidoreductase [Polyangiaceae bacterium]
MAGFGFEESISAFVFGGRGGIGAAIVELIHEQLPGSQVISTSRDPEWVAQAQSGERLLLDPRDPKELEKTAAQLKDQGFQPQLVFNATGLLHQPSLTPERALKELNPRTFEETFAINTFAVGYMLQAFVPLLPRKKRSVFASLSARVGSIEDCRLGGWYSYRASKAAQNMLLRCAAIEAKRTHPGLCCLALHPGTVRTQLSTPFTKRRDPGSLFTPEVSARHLEKVICDRTADESGQFFAWDGQAIPW